MGAWQLGRVVVAASLLIISVTAEASSANNSSSNINHWISLSTCWRLIQATQEQIGLADDTAIMDAILKYGQALSPAPLSGSNKENTPGPAPARVHHTSSSNMEINFLSKENREEFKDTMSRVLEMCTQFKTRDKVLEYAEFSDIMRAFNEPLPSSGTRLEALLDMFEEQVLPYSTNLGSPYVMAFPDAGNSVVALTGAVMSDFLNQNLANWRPLSPVGTILEIIVLNWFRQLIGYGVVSEPQNPMEVGGYITSGGVASNAASLLFAREAAFPNCTRTGLKEIDGKYVVLVPADIDHYSTRLASGWLGIGESNVIRVPSKDFRYDLTALKNTVEQLSQDGIRVISLCCYAGDSRSMTCDDFPALRKICDDHHIWMHVDGCHGTQLLFSQKLRDKVRGIELADSITFDPHKVMCVPYVCSVIVLKDPTKLIRRPEDIITGEQHSFGQITPFFGSRAFDSHKLYMLFKHLGLKQLGAMVERRHEMALLLAKKVAADHEMALVNPAVDINSVIFMYVPQYVRTLLVTDEDSGVELLNKLNRGIHDNLLRSGDIWLHTFQIPDSSNVFNFKAKGRILKVLRFMSGNPNITQHHLDVTLRAVKSYGKAILQDILKPSDAPRPHPLLKSPLQGRNTDPVTTSAATSHGLKTEKDISESKVTSTGVSSQDSEHNVPNPRCKDWRHTSYRNARGEMRSDENILPVCSIKSRVSQFTRRVKQFCFHEFAAQEKYVVIVYGSYAYNLAKPTSDLDIVFIAEDVNDARRQRVTDFVLGLHQEMEMSRDDEIPYEHKILLSFQFMRRACQAEGFRTADQCWVIPKIEKSPEALISERLLLRFFMGMLANPTLFVAGDYSTYQAFRGCACKNVIRAVVATQSLTEASSWDMMSHLCVSKDGEFGDFYLGFSYVEPFKSHIVQLLDEFLPGMGLESTPGEAGPVYELQPLAEQAPDMLVL